MSSGERRMVDDALITFVIVERVHRFETFLKMIPSLVDFVTVDNDGPHCENISEKDCYGSGKSGDGMVELL